MLPFEKQALCVSDFRLELREKTTNSRFHNYNSDFQELSNKLSFRPEQSMSTTKPLRKLAIKLFSFFRRKECISELAFGCVYVCVNLLPPGLTMWEVVCKPVLNYGAEVWACSSKTDEQRLERIQNRAGRRILGLSWRFHGVVVRGELGWRKLKYDRHSSALKFAGRLRGMGWERWPKIVGEALSRLQNNGTWVDYIRSLIARYKLQTCWEDDRWNEKVWKKVVVEQVEREGKRAWREEVEGKQDLGSYKDRQLVLERADYIANSSGDKIRAEIKGKCEWGEHFQI